MRIATAVAAAWIAAALLAPGSLRAQERGDTLPPPDTAAVAPDSAAADPDPETARQSDTLDVLPDSLRFDSLPPLHRGAPTGFATAVWEWDRPELMATHAQTLLELLETVPGVVPLRGGDYGTPEIFSAFGLGGGGVRVYRDGLEVLPLDGSVPDLSRVPLLGVERDHTVRCVRRPGEIVMRQHDALGRPGGPRRVDQRRQPLRLRLAA